jgi:hypothetical protein
MNRLPRLTAAEEPTKLASVTAAIRPGWQLTWPGATMLERGRARWSLEVPYVRNAY